MSDSQYNGQTRVQVLLEYLQEREMDLEDLGQVRRIKLEQCIQLCQFETDANQVIIGFWTDRSFINDVTIVWIIGELLFIITVYLKRNNNKRLPKGTPVNDVIAVGGFLWR